MTDEVMNSSYYSQDKKSLRKMMRQKRKKLDHKLACDLNEAVFRRVAGTGIFAENENILTYVSFGDEADTLQIITYALECGKKVFVPKVTGKNMIFVQISALSDLEPGYMGIPEPKDGTKWCAGTGLMLMPGLVFDKKFHRIGYGGGFYDRYLSGRDGLITAAICYDFQILDEIPHEEHDFRPDYIVTDKNTYKRSKND